MKKLILLVWLLAAGLPAQESGRARSGGFVRVSCVYQCWEDDSSADLNQFSTPVTVVLPLRNDVRLSFQADQAVSSTPAGTFRGLTDSQARISITVRPLHMRLHVGANLPSGKTELDQRQFEASRLLTWSLYRFQAPGMGQGFNVSPGITWALPVLSDAVVGAGVVFYRRGAFLPFNSQPQVRYDPGDEIVATAGMDIRVDPRTFASADVMVTWCGADRFDGKEVYRAGEKWTANGRLRRFFGRHELSVEGHVRKRNRGKVAAADLWVPVGEKSLPDEASGKAGFRYRIDRITTVGFLAETRFLSASRLHDKAGVVGFGAAPEFRVRDGFDLTASFSYCSGKVGNRPIHGLEMNAGMQIGF
jgi:hypothetical protein